MTEDNKSAIDTALNVVRAIARAECHRYHSDMRGVTEPMPVAPQSRDSVTPPAHDLQARLDASQKQLLERERQLAAANGEINKLRGHLRLADGAVRSGHYAVLTTREKQVLEEVINSEHARGAWQWADTLKGLLERLS